MLKHRGKEKIKVQFDIMIKKVTNLPKTLNGSTIFVEWKRRGSKSFSGMTKRSLVTNNETSWNESFSFSAHIFKDPKSDRFDPKKLYFTLKEDIIKTKSSKDIGKAKLDVSNYVKNKGGTVTLSFAKGHKSHTLEVSIKSHWVKLGNKLLIKAEEAADVDKKNTVEIEGESFVLKTDENLSESTAETTSVSNDFEPVDDVVFEEDEKGNHTKNLEHTIAEVEAESFERLQTIHAQQKELEFLRQQLAVLKQESSEKLKELSLREKEQLDARLLRDLDENSENGSQNNGRPKSSPRESKILKERLKELKHENAEKDKTIRVLEEERDKYKKQLELFKSRIDENDLKVKVNFLESQLEEKMNLIARHEHEVKRLKKKLKSSSREVVDEDSGKSNGKNNLTQELEHLKLEWEEKTLLETNIYCCVPAYTNNVPNSASAIFRALLGWKAFQNKSKILNDIIRALDVSFQRSRYDTEMLAYWLSTLSNLLYKLKQEQCNGKPTDRDTLSAMNKFDKDITKSLISVYTLLVKNICKELEGIVVPAIFESAKINLDRNNNVTLTNTTNRNLLRFKVGAITQVLARECERLQQNHLPEALIAQCIRQIYFFIDVTLFNELMDRRDLCTTGHGFQIKIQLSQLEGWVLQKSKPFHFAKEELVHTIQATHILVMDKASLVDKEVLAQIAPDLNIYQVKQLIEMYQPDQLAPEAVPAAVIDKINSFYVSQKRSSDIALKLDPFKFYDLNFSYLPNPKETLKTSTPVPPLKL